MLAIFTERRPNDSELLKAARAVFSRDIGLATYPGPAAILREDGAVIIANAAASPVAEALGMGQGRALHPVLAGAIRDGRYTAAAITLDPGTDGAAGGATYEFTVMPLVPGSTALVIGRDTALETAFRGAITESRQRYKDLVDICGDFCWETDADGRFSFVSPGGALDYAADDLVGHRSQDFLDPLTGASGTSPFQARTPVDVVDVWFRRADGQLACLETSARPIVDGGQARGVRGVCRDVTAERRQAEQFSRSQIRKQVTAHIMRVIRDEFEPEKMLQAAAQATAPAVGAQGCRIYRAGRDGALLAAAEFGQNAPSEEAVAGILAQARGDGRPCAAEFGTAALLGVATSYHHAANGAIVLWRAAADGGWSADDSALVGDIAVQLGVALQQIRNQLQLETLSRTDELTGLLNRRAFTTELEARVARADPAPGALFYVDLDNFKPVNDVLGHQKGDEALVAVADMLRRGTRPGDLVARLGGDEFALWLDRTDTEAARIRASDLLDASAELSAYSGIPEQPLGISIGIAVCTPGTSEGLDGLMARADAAMYEVKHNGKAGYVLAPSARDGSSRQSKALSA